MRLKPIARAWRAALARATRLNDARASAARRRLSAKGTWGAAIAGFVTLILCVGCSKHPRSGEPDQVLRISQRNEPADLDPATASLPDEFFIIRALSEGLLTPNPNGGAPLPAAADRFEVSPDRLTYTFHLRPAQWSNGEPVTATDFFDSYRRVLTPATAAPKAHLFYAIKNARAFVSGAITDFSAVGIHAVDRHTLVITLAEPVADFPLYVASGAWIPVNPRVVARHDRAWTKPGNFVGNGPFTLAEWRPQQRIVVRKNPRYHDAAAVRLQEIQFIRFDNQDTEERAFRAGQLDVTMAVPQAKLDGYAREHPDELHHAPLAETRFIAFNTTRPPLQDQRVRLALSLAIDREKIVARVLHGGQLPAERFLSPALLQRGRSDNSPTSAQAGKEHARSSGAEVVTDPANRHAFDAAAARELMAQAGFPNGKGFPRLEFSGWDRNPALEAIQQMWRQELGIDTELVVREAKVHLAALNAGNYDLAFVTNLLDVRDPVAALADFTTGAPNNFPHWRSPAFDQLVTAATTTPAEQQRARVVAAERLLLAAAPVAPVYFNTQNWLMSDRVHGWEQDALWSRRYNDLWLDAK